MEYQLLGRMISQRFCELTDPANIRIAPPAEPSRTEATSRFPGTLFHNMELQRLKQGYITRSGQIIDATLIPAAKQHFIRDNEKQLKEGTILVN